MKIRSENLIVKLTFEFALDIIDYAELLEFHKKFVIAKQVLSAGTSIGANVKEAQNAESRPDFVHKMKIAAKEADETEYWLLLCEYSPNYPKNEKLKEKLNAIINILSKIIITSKAH
jgi:four helix bundle protein